MGEKKLSDGNGSVMSANLEDAEAIITSLHHCISTSLRYVLLTVELILLAPLSLT